MSKTNSLIFHLHYAIKKYVKVLIEAKEIKMKVFWATSDQILSFLPDVMLVILANTVKKRTTVFSTLFLALCDFSMS